MSGFRYGLAVVAPKEASSSTKLPVSSLPPRISDRPSANEATLGYHRPRRMSPCRVHVSVQGLNVYTVL
jgi:hypothetical protein